MYDVVIESPARSYKCPDTLKPVEFRAYSPGAETVSDGTNSFVPSLTVFAYSRQRRWDSQGSSLPLGFGAEHEDLKSRI